jgi:hypothetical protein
MQRVHVGPAAAQGHIGAQSQQLLREAHGRRGVPYTTARVSPEALPEHAWGRPGEGLDGRP